eukprot:CAMPEP_0174831734 /NCGR_PEP_ID=MMETSP1114-20130205/3269_1 /TAXON_ID=312471 /ORGANISM="Neobodo designis, Strain CCAP 1951/1" /LENGTH=80 /DNA_ID=CAMNT_0016065571 /DNA_START=183 /DNA_END=425 /DNA_ORIENTATION=-
MIDETFKKQRSTEGNPYSTPYMSVPHGTAYTPEATLTKARLPASAGPPRRTASVLASATSRERRPATKPPSYRDENFPIL